MSINPFKRFGVLAMAGLICCGSTHAVDAPAYSWKKTEHTTCLMNGEKVVWQHNHDPAEGKSYIHPLSTSHGEVLTWLRPKDHVWHRAMWFSWKYIQKEGEKKLNYWEERRGKSEG